MKIDQLLNEVKNDLTEHRFRHTLGVKQTALELAKHYHVSPEQAEVAAIAHDIAKFWPEARLKTVLTQEITAGRVRSDILQYNKELWHAPVGAAWVNERFGIREEVILDAVRYHTSARTNMSALEKIIWLADYIEPNRNFPGVETVRALAFKDLDEAMITGLAQTIQFLLSRRQLVYPLTLEAYNDLVKVRAQKAVR
jgi:predicted HD superfamily hydrolase involved in NAD metabolism